MQGNYRGEQKEKKGQREKVREEKTGHCYPIRARGKGFKFRKKGFKGCIVHMKEKRRKGKSSSGDP